MYPSLFMHLAMKKWYWHICYFYIFINLFFYLSGNFTIPVPQNPSVFAFGWPPVLVNVSFFAIPFQGTVQYDLLYNRTCPWLSDIECSEDTRNLTPVASCHRVEKQNSTHIKRFSCVICNSTEKCRTMGISKDCDLCLYFKVNVTNPVVSSRHTCMQRGYLSICEYSDCFLCILESFRFKDKDN